MKHLFMFFGFVVLIGFLHINFITTLGDNVMNVSAAEKNVIQFLFPQGWGFFTRNPKEPNYKLYRIEDGKPQLVTFRITSSKNYYGLSRKGSRLGMEMHRIKSKLPPSAGWSSSTTSLKDMRLDTLSYPCLDTVSKLLYIQEGDYILKEYHLSPWSWAKHQGRYSKTFKYIPFQLIKS